MFIQPLFSLWSIYITILYHTIFLIPIPLYNFLPKNPFWQTLCPHFHYHLFLSLNNWKYPFIYSPLLTPPIFTSIPLKSLHLLFNHLLSLQPLTFTQDFKPYFVYLLFQKYLFLKTFFISLLTKQYYYKNDTYVDNVFQWKDLNIITNI